MHIADVIYIGGCLYVTSNKRTKGAGEHRNTVSMSIVPSGECEGEVARRPPANERVLLESPPEAAMSGPLHYFSSKLG